MPPCPFLLWYEAYVTMTVAYSDKHESFSGEDVLFSSYVDMLPVQLKEALRARGLADPGILAAYPLTPPNQLGLGLRTVCIEGDGDGFMEIDGGATSADGGAGTVSSSFVPVVSTYTSAYTSISQASTDTARTTDTSLRVSHTVHTIGMCNSEPGVTGLSAFPGERETTDALPPSLLGKDGELTKVAPKAQFPGSSVDLTTDALPPSFLGEDGELTRVAPMAQFLGSSVDLTTDALPPSFLGEDGELTSVAPMAQFPGSLVESPKFSQRPKKGRVAHLKSRNKTSMARSVMDEVQGSELAVGSPSSVSHGVESSVPTVVPLIPATSPTSALARDMGVPLTDIPTIARSTMKAATRLHGESTISTSTQPACLRSAPPLIHTAPDTATLRNQKTLRRLRGKRVTGKLASLSEEAKQCVKSETGPAVSDGC